MKLAILSFFLSLMVATFIIPSLIRFTKKRKITDNPGKRRSHISPTPTLGGLAIFIAMFFTTITVIPVDNFYEVQFILSGIIVVSLLGVKDDVVNVSASIKLGIQVAVALMLVLLADVQIPSLFGVFGVHGIPLWLNYSFSVFTIVVIINAYNLVDGIDLLCGSLTILACAFFGIWFLLIGEIALTIIAFSLMGALAIFLRFNWSPAMLFLGDSGSLLAGLVVAVLSIKFINFNASGDLGVYTFQSAPAMAIAVMIIPLFDTLRVFILRALKNGAPFKPDRRHIHHLLIDTGLSHTRATLTLVLTTMSFVAIAFLLRDMSTLYLILLLVGLALVGTYVLSTRKTTIEKVRETEVVDV